MTEAPPARRRPSRTAVLLIALAVLVYGAVVALYAASGRSDPIDTCEDKRGGEDLVLALLPQGVDAAADRIAATLDVVDFGDLDPDTSGVPEETVSLVVTDVDGSRTFAFDEGAIPSPIVVRFITQGEVEDWPFDRHEVEFGIVATTGEGARTEVRSIVLCGAAHVPGWTFDTVETAGGPDLVVNGEQVAQVRLTAHRAVATIAFGLVVLAAMCVLPVLALIVATRVLRGRRKAEATLTSWIAAMLFATIPLRGFLPGSPPIGSWVDYLIVLWVVVGLIAALVVYVVAWLRWAPPGERPAP